MNQTAENIIDIAERMMRDGGYHCFSFRKIADELGIKSASIHYHFPNKESLGAAVVERYTEMFLSVLREPEAHKDAVGHYIQTFQKALKANNTACLCGILAAEAGRLPESVCQCLEVFTQSNLAWLEKAFKISHPEWSPKKVKEMASVVFSSLEGAIIFAAMTEQPAHLAQVAKSLKSII